MQEAIEITGLGPGYPVDPLINMGIGHAAAVTTEYTVQVHTM